MRKYRHELKYIISQSQALVLQNRLHSIMEIDTNSVYKDHTYKIRSLYFDNDSSDAYYEKLNGVLYREKYRIRYYNDDDTFIRLERKLKHNNMTSKDQIIITREICDKIINGEVEELNGTGLLEEFLNDVRRKHLKPSVIVDYTRLAYTYPISEVRITFDSKIKSGRYDYELFDNELLTIPVIEDEEVVLEVKFNEVLPETISIILSTIPMYRQAVSKFALCRSIK
ncbi:MAG: polyphosphate polymerase domain-containing protein [Bacilli bacterium]|nr:polyphosphate polymerase domain-containing protein [Bacilli bacterium]